MRMRSIQQYLTPLSLLLADHKAALPANPQYTPPVGYANLTKDAFIESLVSQMNLPELVMQLYLMFGDNVVGPNSDNALYDQALFPAPPDAGIGVIHDWYPLNKSYFNDLQQLNLDKSRLKIPFLNTGECLHGVGSFKQSIFPQPLGMSSSWDTGVIHRVGRAIGTEARSIGVGACFSPVLDICQDPRWGRCQEDWGEDQVLTSHMGVAYAAGLSKNSAWKDLDAVVPVMKHFAAHGAPQSGLNAAPFMGHGNRQVLEQLLVPFKAAVDLGGARGVMMAYSEVDDVPSSVSPMLYDSLASWGYDGFVIADDTGVAQLESRHMVAGSAADAISQWFNAGGMISYYDYLLPLYLNATIDLVANHSVALSLLQEKVRRILGVKYDLGLFEYPFIPEDIDPDALTDQHVPLTLEAARKSIVLLENKNETLPLDVKGSDVKKYALVGPFSDILNYGDYSGQFGAYPIAHSSTIRQGMLQRLQDANSSAKLVSAMGANTWLYNAQYPIPGYHLSTLNGTSGGLSATYFADTNFGEPLVHAIEVPVRDWGLYPPPGLPSNNFSAIWEGTLDPSVDIETDGWLGIAIGPNTTAKVYVDEQLLVDVPITTAISGNILSNLPVRSYSLINGTAPPPGSANFTFQPGTKHKIRIEYQTWNLYQKIENESSLNAEVLLFWNLVDRLSAVQKAVELARNADVIILALGGNWNTDGEGGDRGTMSLSANQSALADAIFALEKPVVLILEGGRPFAIPDYYNRSAAVLNSYFGGQTGGQAMAEVLFGDFNPGGRIPLTIPRHMGQLPTYYNYKATVHDVQYVDIESAPCYSFGYGLSYSNFSLRGFRATVRSLNASKTSPGTFSSGDIITFSVIVKNTGRYFGSYVPQVYLLQRMSQITQPVKQLVAFTRVYVDPGQSEIAHMDLEVDRYLRMLNRKYEWDLEKGSYTFVLAENGGPQADTTMNVTMRCI